jgi:hypothetical protein
MSLDQVIQHLDNVEALGKKLYSFDLHGTLVIPQTSMADHVFSAIAQVFAQNGIDLIEDNIEYGERFLAKLMSIYPSNYEAVVRELTREYLTNIIHEDSKTYKKSIIEFERNNPSVVKSIGHRMALVNVAVMELTLGYEVDLDTGHQIHKKIVEDTQGWKKVPQISRLLNHVYYMESKPTMALLSNGPRDEVLKTVKRYFKKWFKPAFVITPEDVNNFRKPQPEYFVGAIVSARCAKYRKKGWQEVLQKAVSVSQGIITNNRGLGDESIAAGVGFYAGEMGIDVTKLSMRYSEMHHIGNSKLHDRVPRMSIDAKLEGVLNRVLGVQGYE